MNGPNQSTPIPKSAPTDFDALYVQGVEINPEDLKKSSNSKSDAKKLPFIKPLNLKGEISVEDIAKSFNLLIGDLQSAGLMEKK